LVHVIFVTTGDKVIPIESFGYAKKCALMFVNYLRFKEAGLLLEIHGMHRLIKLLHIDPSQFNPDAKPLSMLRSEPNYSHSMIDKKPIENQFQETSDDDIAGFFPEIRIGARFHIMVPCRSW
jgi:hypothetical protein